MLKISVGLLFVARATAIALPPLVSSLLYDTPTESLSAIAEASSLLSEYSVSVASTAVAEFSSSYESSHPTSAIYASIVSEIQATASSQVESEILLGEEYLAEAESNLKNNSTLAQETLKNLTLNGYESINSNLLNSTIDKFNPYSLNYSISQISRFLNTTNSTETLKIFNSSNSSISYLTPFLNASFVNLTSLVAPVLVSTIANETIEEIISLSAQSGNITYLNSTQVNTVLNNSIAGFNTYFNSTIFPTFLNTTLVNLTSYSPSVFNSSYLAQIANLTNSTLPYSSLNNTNVTLDSLYAIGNGTWVSTVESEIASDIDTLVNGTLGVAIVNETETQAQSVVSSSSSIFSTLIKLLSF